MAELNVRRLQNAITQSRRNLQRFRENRLAFIKEFVGHRYSDNGADDRVPTNFIELAVNIYVRHLAAQAPAVLITTKDDRLKPASEAFGLAMNHLLKEIDFETTLQRWVTDAMFSIGILKVGITPLELGEQEGFLHDATQPFADVVDLDDWVHDTTARRYEQIQFAGNRYRLPIEVVEESDDFDTRGLTLQPAVETAHNEQGDERTSSIAGEEGSDRRAEAEFDPTVELWDIWIPRRNQVITMLAEEPGGGPSTRKPLRIIEWEGPEEGPYHVLGFGDVPNNVMPLSPVQVLYDMHDLANVVFRKLARQAVRQKTIGIGQVANQEDADAITNSSDGEFHNLQNPNGAKEMRFGGVDSTNFAFFLQLKDLIYQMPGGNLDALGGLSPQSETLGQDELITASASVRMRDYQNRVYKATKAVVEALADYIWYDPLIDPPLTKHVEGTSVEIPVSFSEEIREGDFLDYNVDFSPYSMQSRTPQQKLNTIMQAMQGLYLPALPYMQEQGITVDWEELANILAGYSDTEELRKILTLAQPGPGIVQPQTGAGEGDQPRQSPVTRRENVRVNRTTGGSRAGRDAVLMRALLNQDSQDAEMASLASGVG